MNGRASYGLRAWLLALLLSCASSIVFAHPLDTASLSLTEVAPNQFRVTFNAGSAALRRELVTPAVFPKACRLDGADLICQPPGLVGAIQFPWLEGTLTRLMVDIEWRGGSRLLRVITASAPALTVYGPPDAGWLSLKHVLIDYGCLGIEHILSGFDHLMFVVALTILVRGRARRLATVTAFTLAHSLTLALTVLGVLNVPAAPVEVTIALSIVLVAAECLRPGGTLSQRAPWLIAFAFGLLHGLGFASALLEIGLPEEHVASALVCFNLGVELGQLVVMSVAALLLEQVERLTWGRERLLRPLLYAMGGIAAFWTLERVGALFSG
jgi:hydrogenase/urease accessory protein HupE